MECRMTAYGRTTWYNRTVQFSALLLSSVACRTCRPGALESFSPEGWEVMQWPQLVK